MALSFNINNLRILLKMKLVACEKGSSDNPESRASEVQPQTKMEVRYTVAGKGGGRVISGQA
jgi:hypothetical protein